MKNRCLWLSAGLMAGIIGAVVVRQRRRTRTVAWTRQRHGPQTALVTGASSGIGAAYARQLAVQGHSLILVARREPRLRAVADALHRECSVPVEVLAADLSTEAGIARVEQRLAAGDVNFLVNNAGYDVFGDFAEVPIDKTLGLINCLALAPVRLCRAALPGMLACRQGAIVNVASIGAFLPKPKDATYTAAKAYLTVFSQALARELAPAGVRVQALCPGFTLSEFHDDPQFAPYHVRERIPRWLWMTPAEVVDASLRDLAQDREVCIPGWPNQAMVAVARIGIVGALWRPARNLLPQRPEPRRKI